MVAAFEERADELYGQAKAGCERLARRVRKEHFKSAHRCLIAHFRTSIGVEPLQVRFSCSGITVSHGSREHDRTDGFEVGSTARPSNSADRYRDVGVRILSARLAPLPIRSQRIPPLRTVFDKVARDIDAFDLGSVLNM